MIIVLKASLCCVGTKSATSSFSSEPLMYSTRGQMDQNGKQKAETEMEMKMDLFNTDNI